VQDFADFEFRKAEFKLEQAERRVAVIESDWEENQLQIEYIVEHGTFPPKSTWSIKTRSLIEVKADDIPLE